MGKNLSLSFFFAPGADSIALRQEVEKLLQQFDFNWHIPSHPILQDVVKACCQEDIIIFDASIEDAGNDYQIAYEQLKRIQYALIV